MVLDLKNNTGSLGKRWLDLPPLPSSVEPYYFRRSETGLLPPSYRSGLVFFAAVMVVMVLGLTGIHAKTLAESQESWISAQLIEDFYQLRMGLEPSRNEGFIRKPEVLPTLLKNDDAEPDLQELRAKLFEGDEAFRQLTNIWKDPENNDLINRLDRLKSPAEDSLERWDEVLVETESIPELREARKTLESSTNFLRAFLLGYSPMKELLGAESPQRLLIFLQDPGEKRATGGTLSAGVEILMNEGKVITWKPFSGKEYASVMSANSFLDFPQSAEKMHAQWQREAHSSVDALIVMNTTALEKILHLEHFSRDWTRLRMTEQYEALKNLTSTSIEELLSFLKNPDEVLGSWPEIESLVRQKQLMIFSTDPDLQSQFNAFHLSAALPSLAPHDDALMVASVNSDTNTSDLFVEERDILDTAIRADGSIHHWLKINRHNAGNDFGNRSLMRILVPLGSQITSLDGLTMSELGSMNTDQFTVWSFHVSLVPGESKELALSYTLPWSFDTASVDNYRLTLLKQPGSNPIAFEHHIKLPADLTIFQQLPEEEISVLDRDIDIAVVAGKNP